MAKIPTLNLSVTAQSYSTINGKLISRNDSGLTVNHKKYASSKWLVSHFPFWQIICASIAANGDVSVTVRSLEEPVLDDVINNAKQITGTPLMEAENQEGGTVIFKGENSSLQSESMDGPIGGSSSKDKTKADKKSSEDKGDKKKGKKPDADEDDTPKKASKDKDKSSKGKDGKKPSKKTW